MLPIILSWITMLAPLEPHSQTDPIAAAIATAAGSDLAMAATLTSISFSETRVGHRGVPFGACGHLCHSHCGNCHSLPLVDVATWSAGVIRTGLRICGGNRRCSLVFYHLGSVRNWRDDHFAAREYANVERMLASRR